MSNETRRRRSAGRDAKRAERTKMRTSTATFIDRKIPYFEILSEEGMQLIEEIVQVYENYDFDTELIVASVRHPMHVVDAALLGADVVTMPHNVIDKLLSHPLTDIGLEKFMADYRKSQK